MPKYQNTFDYGLEYEYSCYPICNSRYSIEPELYGEPTKLKAILNIQSLFFPKEK